MMGRITRERAAPGNNFIEEFGSNPPGCIDEPYKSPKTAFSPRIRKTHAIVNQSSAKIRRFNSSSLTEDNIESNSYKSPAKTKLWSMTQSQSVPRGNSGAHTSDTDEGCSIDSAPRRLFGTPTKRVPFGVHNATDDGPPTPQRSWIGPDDDSDDELDYSEPKRRASPVSSKIGNRSYRTEALRTDSDSGNATDYTDDASNDENIGGTNVPGVTPSKLKNIFSRPKRSGEKFQLSIPHDAPTAFGDSGILSGEHFLRAIDQDIFEFANTQVAENVLARCKVVRTRLSSKNHGKLAMYVYEMFLDIPDSPEVPILVARRFYKGKGYHSYLSTPDGVKVGKLKSSNGSKTFTLYDNGLSERKEMKLRMFGKDTRAEQKQKVLGSVNYVQRKKGPRQLIAHLPATNGPGGLTKDITLKNMLPTWNSKTKKYSMKFFGRAHVSSIKNFQLVDDILCNEDGQQQPHRLLFGKIDDSTFSLDFRHPFTPLQAFAYALTAFEKSVKEVFNR